MTAGNKDRKKKQLLECIGYVVKIEASYTMVQKEFKNKLSDLIIELESKADAKKALLLRMEAKMLEIFCFEKQQEINDEQKILQEVEALVKVGKLDESLKMLDIVGKHLMQEKLSKSTEVSKYSIKVIIFIDLSFTCKEIRRRRKQKACF